MTDEEHNKLVLDSAALVDGVLRATMRRFRLPEQVKDDLRQAGYVGLVQASKKFDPGRGTEFTTFAAPRVRGEMIDTLRKSNAGVEVPHEVDVTTASSAPNPEESLRASQEAEKGAQALKDLAEPARRLVEAHFAQGMTLAEIAREHGISKSWASRIRKRAMQSMVLKSESEERGQER